MPSDGVAARRPTAWGSRTSGRRGRRRWRRRSTRRGGWPAAALLDALGSDAEGEVEAQGVAAAAVRVRADAAPEGTGTDTALPVAFAGLAAMRAAFAAAHRARFGFDPGDAAAGDRGGAGRGGRRGGGPGRAGACRRPGAEVEAALVAPVFLGGRLGRGALRAARGAAAGGPVSGPAVLVEPHTLILVEPGWQARVTGHDHVELVRVEARPGRHAVGTAGRPGDARGVQQPLHVDRRADGGGAGEHRRQRHDQGAAGFLLRGVRCARGT